MISRFLAFIRFSHTIFALPFALGAMFVAAHGRPPIRIFLLVILAMVFARTAAMCFNRLADWEIDRRNPRTEGRHKLISRAGAVVAWALSSAGFVATTFFLNHLCWALSPVALAIIFFYSLTKRFTSLSHLFLGLALAVAPVGAWIAVTGHFALSPLVLSVAVLFWVAGFDVIYATQDFDFDRREGLHSLVVKLGVSRSLVAAQILHAGMFVLLVAFGFASHLGLIYFGSLALVFGALVYEHRVARGRDVAAINRAFFSSNAFVGFVFATATLMDRLLDAN